MNGLITAAIDRGRAVTTLLIFLLVAGLAAYRAIPKEANPDVAKIHSIKRRISFK